MSRTEELELVKRFVKIVSQNSSSRHKNVHHLLLCRPSLRYPFWIKTNVEWRLLYGSAVGAMPQLRLSIMTPVPRSHADACGQVVKVMSPFITLSFRVVFCGRPSRCNYTKRQNSPSIKIAISFEPLLQL